MFTCAPQTEKKSSLFGGDTPTADVQARGKHSLLRRQGRAARILGNKNAMHMNQTQTDKNSSRCATVEGQQQATTPLRCQGRAADALMMFRQRKKELENLKQRKPDMVAYKELHKTWAPSKTHGEIRGVPIGFRMRGRGEAAILGIHTQMMRGIDATKGKACFAVCISGGYADDDDQASDGTVLYTGSGGQKGKRQVKDQEENCDNVSLIKSIQTQQPIRVIRGAKTVTNKPVYFYDGLYQCIDYNFQPSADGPKVYQFTLIPIQGKSKHTIRVSVPHVPAAAGKAGITGRKEARLLALESRKKGDERTRTKQRRGSSKMSCEVEM